MASSYNQQRSGHGRCVYVSPCACMRAGGWPYMTAYTQSTARARRQRSRPLERDEGGGIAVGWGIYQLSAVIVTILQCLKAWDGRK